MAPRLALEAGKDADPARLPCTGRLGLLPGLGARLTRPPLQNPGCRNTAGCRSAAPAAPKAPGRGGAPARRCVRGSCGAPGAGGGRAPRGEGSRPRPERSRRSPLCRDATLGGSRNPASCPGSAFPGGGRAGGSRSPPAGSSPGCGGPLGPGDPRSPAPPAGASPAERSRCCRARHPGGGSRPIPSSGPWTGWHLPGRGLASPLYRATSPWQPPGLSPPPPAPRGGSRSLPSAAGETEARSGAVMCPQARWGPFSPGSTRTGPASGVRGYCPSARLRRGAGGQDWRCCRGMPGPLTPRCSSS